MVSVHHRYKLFPTRSLTATSTPAYAHLHFRNPQGHHCQISDPEKTPVETNSRHQRELEGHAKGVSEDSPSQEAGSS